MKVLLLGSGARTHALAKRVVASGGEVWCIPMVALWRADPRIHAGPADADLGAVARWAAEAGVELVVGMDEHAAYVDAGAAFAAQGVVYFGPSRTAAELERSKRHSRRVLEDVGVELPALLDVITDPDDVVVPGSFPVVLKLDRGVSAQGVRVAEDPTAFARALRSLVAEHAAAGDDDPLTVLVEAFVPGFEVTFAALAGAEAIVDLPPVRDYKRLNEGDCGPLTSGMGGYSPVPSLPAGWEAFQRDLFARVLAHVERSGTKYVGYVNANAIHAGGRWVVLELNCHMGDPDLTLLLPQIDGDVAQIMYNLATGAPVPDAVVRPRPSLAISLVAEGYPGPVAPPRGVVARPPAGEDDLYLFKARQVGAELVPMGGRVLLACATSPSFRDTVQTAYATAAQAHGVNPTLIYRRDVGAEALA